MISKRTVCTLAIILLLLTIFSCARSSPSERGPYVDQHWWQIIEGPDAQLKALTAHDIDAMEISRPTDLDAIKAAGLTITRSEGRLGYNMLLMNNLVYPCDDVHFRRAIIRLVDKDALDTVSWPLQRHMEYWLPESMPMWINPDVKLPMYNPADANAILDNAGYVYSTVPTPAGWYDPEVPGSQPYYRINPWTGQRMADFEYVTRPMDESPLCHKHSLIIIEKLHAMGIPARLKEKSWSEIVPILTNSDPTDYQMLTGVSIVWGSLSPDILYAFLQSEQFPLWNLWNFEDEDADYWCAQMKATLDNEELWEAVCWLQAIANDYIPYVPVMQDLAYTAFAGPYDTPPIGGSIKIVNMRGIGTTGGPADALAFGTWPVTNQWGKEFGESGRIEGGKNVNKWGLGARLTTLNPLCADTVADWQILDLIFGDFLRLHPYILDYIFRAIEDVAVMAEWMGPGGEPGMTLEYTLREGIVWHDGVPVTADDCVFALNLLRFQENERYRYVWEPIYDVKQTGPYSFKIWYLQRYIFAHEYFGISLLCPKHIWEDFVDSPETGEPLVIDYGAGPFGGDMWTSPGRHHSEFDPWDVAHPTEPDLTCLIGTDNFKFGHWTEKVSCSVEAWKDEDNYMPRINPGDCTLDGFVEHWRDTWNVLYRQGDFRGRCYPEEIGGDPRWDPIADIAGAAQIIQGDEIFVVHTNFGEHWWPLE